VEKKSPFDGLSLNKDILLSESLISLFVVLSLKINDHFILLYKEGNDLLDSLEVFVNDRKFGAFFKVATVDGLIVGLYARVIRTVIEYFDVIHVSIDDGLIKLSYFFSY
jgi:hypothetical protein